MTWEKYDDTERLKLRKAQLSMRGPQAAAAIPLNWKQTIKWRIAIFLSGTHLLPCQSLLLLLQYFWYVCFNKHRWRSLKGCSSINNAVKDLIMYIGNSYLCSCIKVFLASMVNIYKKTSYRETGIVVIFIALSHLICIDLKA